jgi:hypothetical protein
MFKNIRKFIGYALIIIGKLSTLAISIPATAAVAETVFKLAGITDKNQLLIMQGSAVLGVEYVLLSNWYKLATDKQAPIEIKLKRSVTALVMFFAMLVISFLHGEGLAGWVFRLSLLLALLDDMSDSLLWTWRKLTEKSDKISTNDITQDRRVKRARHKIDRQLAIEEIEFSADQKRKERALTELADSADREVESARINLEKEYELKSLNLSSVSANKQNNSSGKIPLKSRTDTRTDRLNKIRDFMTANPTLGKHELVAWIMTELNVTDRTAWRYLAAL